VTATHLTPPPARPGAVPLPARPGRAEQQAAGRAYLTLKRTTHAHHDGHDQDHDDHDDQEGGEAVAANQ
jgi:hypothetical protein